MILIFHYNSVAKIINKFKLCQISALNISKYDKFFAFYNYFVILFVEIQRLTPCKEVYQVIEWSMTARRFPLFNASSMRSWMINSQQTPKAMICGKVRAVTRRKARLSVLVVTSRPIATTATSTTLPRTTSHYIAYTNNFVWKLRCFISFRTNCL